MKSHENPQFRIPMARPTSHLREGLESATRSPRRRAVGTVPWTSRTRSSRCKGMILGDMNYVWLSLSLNSLRKYHQVDN